MKAQSQGEQPMKKYNGWNDNKSVAGGVGGKPGPFEEQPEQERGVSYPVQKKLCCSCGEKFNPDTEDRVIIIDDDREYYFCEKCSKNNEHCKPIQP